MASTENVGAVLESIKASISDVKQHDITIKGEKSVYIKADAIKNIGKMIDQAISLATPSDGEAILEVKKLYEDLKHKNTVITKNRDEWKKCAEDRKKFYDNALSKVQAQQQEFTDLQESLKTNEKSYSIKLQDVNFELDSLRNQLKSSEAKFQPETAVELRNRILEGEREAIGLKTDLDAIKEELRVTKQQREEDLRAVAKAKSEADEANRELGKIKAEKKLLDTSQSLRPRMITPATGLLKVALGANAMSWLHKLDVVNQADLRDRAFHLLQTVQHSDSKSVSPYKVVLQAFFNHVKKGTGKALAVLNDWLTEFENDLKSWTLRGLSYYRQKLEVIFENLKANHNKVVKAAQTKHKEYKQKYSWYSKYSEPFERIFVKTKRAFFKVRSTLKKKAKAVQNFCARSKDRLWALFSIKKSDVTSEEEHSYFFDAEKEIITMTDDDDPYTGNVAVPLQKVYTTQNADGTISTVKEV